MTCVVGAQPLDVPQPTGGRNGGARYPEGRALTGFQKEAPAPTAGDASRTPAGTGGKAPGCRQQLQCVQGRGQ